MKLTDEAKNTILQIARYIQQGELSRTRGTLNVELVNEKFSWEEVTKVGQQRIDAALYLYESGFRFVGSKKLE